MSGCKPGATSEQNAVLDHWQAETYNAGCYNPGSVFDGTHTPSDHARGDAYDIGIEPPWRGRGSTGQAIFMYLYANRGALAILQLIYDEQIYDERGGHGAGIRPYTANPHHDHIHVSLDPNRDGSPIGVPGFGALPAPAPSPYPPADGSVPTLHAGARGLAVSFMQQLLVNHGAHIAVDGVFGPATTSAVVTFQRARGLAADGICGPRTWAALTTGGAPPATPAPAPPHDAGSLPGTPVLRDGSRGQAVRLAQTLLNGKGAHLIVDGVFGHATTKAVQVFQSNVRAHLAPIAVDGVIGPQTWYWLAR